MSAPPAAGSKLARFYRSNAIPEAKLSQLTALANASLAAAGSATSLSSVEGELCYYIEFDAEASLEGLSEERASWRARRGGGVRQCGARCGA